MFSDTSIGHWSSADGKLGLAFRNPSTDVLMYARWSQNLGWTTPQPIPPGCA